MYSTEQNLAKVRTKVIRRKKMMSKKKREASQRVARYMKFVAILNKF